MFFGAEDAEGATLPTGHPRAAISWSGGEDSCADALRNEWTASGADAIIVTARAEFLDESWLGRPLRREMLDDFARLGVDPCGERGEYHTVVTNSPLFSAPLDVVHGAHVLRSGCHALDLALRTENSELKTGNRVAAS